MDQPGNQDQGEVLSQSEVERLLAQVEADNAVSESQDVGGTSAAPDKRRPLSLEVQPYDFRQPSFLSQNQMRRLRILHESFLRSLSARMSLYLRLEFAVQMTRLHTLPYQKFVDELASPTHLTLFKAEPLRGICLLDVPPRLGLTIVDRLLGGPAHSVSLDREMSEIELALLNQAVGIVLAEWCSQWAKIKDIRPHVLGHENNGRFLQSSPHDTVMLAVSIEVRLGDCLEQMQFAFPCRTLEPLVSALNAITEKGDDAPTPGETPRQRRWNPSLAHVRVPVIAEWQNLRLSARQLAGLKPGDVLPLSPGQSSDVKVRLAKVTRFNGRLGTAGDRLAVQLSSVLKS
jgi:flagellar motor switch protein FliM